MNYLVSDTVVRMQNAAHARRKEVVLPYSKLVKNIGACILGVGPGGHLGFTESSDNSSIFDMRTHFQLLSRETFERDTVVRKQDTPPTAITQGLANIGEAEERIVILYGPEKGKILGDALYNDISPLNPASYLRKEGVGSSTIIFIDKAAAEQVELHRERLVAREK